MTDDIKGSFPLYIFLTILEIKEMKNEDLNENLPLPTFGLSTPNGIVYISTPRGTKTLDEYGTFKHCQDNLEVGQFEERFKFCQFTTEEKKAMVDEGKKNDRNFIEEMKNAYVPQSYINSMPARDPETNEIVAVKSRAIGKTVVGTRTNLKRSTIEVGPIQAIKKHVEEMTIDFSRNNLPRRPSQELPLPSLESINTHLKEAGIEWQRREQIRQREKKKLIADLKRMTDHELRVYLNLMRHRAIGTLGGSAIPNPEDMAKYMAALEEQGRRRDAASKL